MDIRWLGHACFLLTAGETRVLIDPFLTGNPKAALGPEDVEPTQILITHGHADHMGDAVAISQRTGAPIAGVVELVSWVESQGAANENNQGVNVGGTIDFAGGWARFVPATHSSQISDGPCSIATGIVVGIGSSVTYHLGDTALITDLRLVADRTPIDVALVPIGGFYTMDRHDAVTAVEMIRPTAAIPMHYNTFPAIEADAELFRADVQKRTTTKVAVLDPGESYAV